jgi:hypothetical protein
MGGAAPASLLAHVQRMRTYSLGRIVEEAHMHPRSLLLATAAFLTLSCGPPLDPTGRPPFGDLVDGVDATVRWQDIEGGFWAIQTADGRWLDPHESLPAAYRNNGLQVHVAARALTNVACVHMAGTIVEVTGIRTR